MTTSSDAPQFSFTVSVTITNGQATFVIYDQSGEPTEGPVEVTVHNTQIVYTLVNNNDGLIFVAPEITDDPNNDLSYALSDGDQVLTITDTDADNENICLKLVVAKSSDPSVTFTSPDPQIKNIPPF